MEPVRYLQVMSTHHYNPPNEPWLDVRYSDRDIVVVSKPSGLLSVPGRLHKDSVLERLSEQNSNCYAVHRLDMDTSGVMIFALRRKAERHLNAQFRLRQVEKKYLALVDGLLDISEGVIDASLRREGGLPPRSVIDHENGKSALTHYELIHHESRQTLVHLYPKTGRSHQLRVHMMSIGHPVIGDRIYHPKSETDQRLMLHAYELSFNHPYSEKRMTFRCEPDPEFNFTPEEFDV